MDDDWNEKKLGPRCSAHLFPHCIAFLWVLHEIDTPAATFYGVDILLRTSEIGGDIHMNTSNVGLDAPYSLYASDFLPEHWCVLLRQLGSPGT